MEEAPSPQPMALHPLAGREHSVDSVGVRRETWSWVGKALAGICRKSEGTEGTHLERLGTRLDFFKCRLYSCVRFLNNNFFLMRHLGKLCKWCSGPLMRVRKPGTCYRWSMACQVQLGNQTMEHRQSRATKGQERWTKIRNSKVWMWLWFYVPCRKRFHI